MRMLTVSGSHQHVDKQDATSFTPAELGQVSSPADGLAIKDPGRRTCDELKPDLLGGPLMNLSSPPLYQSCVHHNLPPRSTSSVVCLDKLLSISLTDPERRRAGQTGLYTSTLSVHLGLSTKAAKTSGVSGHRGGLTGGSNSRNCQERVVGRRRGVQSKQWDCKVVQTMHTNGNKMGDLGTRCRSSTLELLSFKEPSPSDTVAGRPQWNADEPAFTSRSNFRHRQHTFNIGPVVSGTASAKTDSAGGYCRSTESQKVSISDDTYYHHSGVEANSPDVTAKTLSLKEALELFRPDFISRSQGRVRRLEHRARRRRALQGSNPDLVQGLRENRDKQKRNCTTPDPLSDNLFKPRERSISGREMQLRSRRIYNQLPEVTRRKEEEKRRTVSQTNRLRAEVFKKRLLDQILQR